MKSTTYSVQNPRMALIFYLFIFIRYLELISSELEVCWCMNKCLLVSFILSRDNNIINILLVN
jgi:hypothetical protein